jgi:hypothetical protein
MTTFLRKIINTLPNKLVRDIEETEADVLGAIRRCKVNGNNAEYELEKIKEAYIKYSNGDISLDDLLEVVYDGIL